MVDKTYCRICEAACGLRVERDEHHNPIKLSPDKNHPVSKGYICAKGTRFLEVARHPSRLNRPMKRGEDGVLHPVSWAEALQFVSDKLNAIRRQYGDHAVGIYYGNPIAFSALGTIGLLSFIKALKTRNIFSAGTQDCQNKFAGGELMHGSPVIHPIPDFANTHLAILFGTNPAVSQTSFVHLEGGTRVFDDLITRGGDIVWVDPRETESAKRWGTHLAINPDGDIWLILALLQLLTPNKAHDNSFVEGLSAFVDAAHQLSLEDAVSRSGISLESIKALAEKIQRSPATAFHMSVGVNHSEFATLSYVGLQALAYVTGNFDAKGGSVFHPLALGLADLFRLAHIGTDKTQSRVGNFNSVLDSLPAGIMADEILTPGRDQIKALLVIAGDPLLSIPGEGRLREAFQSLECVISLDLFENETAKLAHLILPTTSWLERWDVATTTATFQAGPLLQTARPVMLPPGEARDELWIFAKLLEVIGSYHPLRWLGQLPLSRLLPSFGYGVKVPQPKPGSYLGRGPRTPDRKVRFWSASIHREFERLSQSRPPFEGLVLLGRRRKLGHNGWLHHGNRDGDPERYAWMHPADIERYALADGALITISTPAASISLPVRSRAEIKQGTVVVPHGIPGASINALIPSGPLMIEALSGQHKMTNISVQIKKGGQI
jgi:anaerobic selenocysteine-containing dehydrogenase